ncbi:hypothetical protein WP3W18E06_47800 [Raoultella ornithinolytica]|nr:hypothetical protein WP3W18E06_47800 [Raoultella ornithinolytica]
MFNAIDKLLKTIPGLTGREIAKHLDADKKKVNSFLSRNKHLFQQTDDFKWYQSKNREFELSFAPVSWMTQDHFEDALREGANKQVISSQADSLIKISRIWADFFPANTSNQPI